MSAAFKRKMELSRAMATANNTRDLKRKLELSNALAEANNMLDDPIDSRLPQTLVSSRKKRVIFPAKNTFSNSSRSNSLTRQATVQENTRESAKVPSNESQVGDTPNTSNERISRDVGEAIEETVDKTPDDSNGFVREKRGRGLTRGLNTQKYTRKSGEKPKIFIPKGLKRPVGEHSSKHATQIGVLIRLEAPMQVEGWAKISDELKEHLFRKLINKLSYDVEDPHVVHCIWKSFARQYSTFRSNAHKYYLKKKAEDGVTVARQTVYEKLANRCDDWLWLCDFWETEKFKKISKTQSKNREKVKHNHKLGTKSREAHQYENNLDDIDMYELEFRNAKNGWADEEVEANYAKMKELREQQQDVPNGDSPMSAEQICITILGENSSYVKSKGVNKRTSCRNESPNFEASMNQARLEEELASTQAELASTKAELASQKTTVEAVVKCVERMTGKSFSEIVNPFVW